MMTADKPTKIRAQIAEGVDVVLAEATDKPDYCKRPDMDYLVEKRCIVPGAGEVCWFDFDWTLYGESADD